ncbi:N-acetyltransferase domain-containing protein [Trichoderma simmonsii]|uniref:N-acetyltransferase domain-containing protein n=1 Tax=Trichoderma simmonsii TaxID=1491479 RepID=A0A8G0PER3_9HYPO|nr:N-acetyltransferase domain-containing protein [Trichoderma simmonsii]
MAIDAQIRVEPATVADVPELIELVNEGLNPEGDYNIYPHNAHGAKYATDVFEALLKADNSRVKLLVVRDAEGYPIATGTVYNIAAGDVFTSVWNDWGIPLQRGMKQEVLDKLFGAWTKRHNKLMGNQPRVFVEALVTRNTWQKRGCATAILAEADKIADEIDVPLFLDGAVPEFYKRRGYSELLNDTGVEASAVPMLRKKKSERV